MTISPMVMMVMAGVVVVRQLMRVVRMIVIGRVVRMGVDVDRLQCVGMLVGSIQWV